jgi:hypothetical protein
MAAQRVLQPSVTVRRGRGVLRAGLLAAEPLRVQDATVRVAALGVAVTTPRGGAYWLHPWRVTVERPDGPVTRLRVRSGTAPLASLVLAVAGIAVGCRALTRRIGGQG